MKFAYWGGIKSGKFQLWQLFELNGKTTAVFPQAGKKWPAYVIIYRGGSVQLFYEENGEVKTKFTQPMGNDKEGQKHFQLCGAERHWTNDPKVFHNCFKFVFQQDIVMCPYMLFGYYGKLGSAEFNQMIERREPNMKVDLDYTISELKKRRNIIPYKSDKYYETWIFQKCDPNPDVCLERQKNSDRLRVLTQELLTEYDIPYETFDIDSDYSFFGLDKELPKEMIHQDQCLSFDLPSHEVIAERCRTILGLEEETQEG